MRPLLGMWVGSGGGTEPTLDFGFNEFPHINGLPVVGESVFIEPGVTFGTFDVSTFRLLVDGEQVAVGQGPHLITAAMEGHMVSGDQILSKAGKQATGTSEEIGPVVLTFPDFVPPYFTAPSDRGTFTGANFANAASWRKTNVFAQAIELNLGGFIHQGSHLGDYTASLINLSFGGNVTTPLILQGSNAGLVATNTVIQGLRERPWNGGVIGGIEVLKFARGSDFVSVKNHTFRDCGAAIRFGAPISNVLLEDLIISNTQRGIQNYHSSPETSATCTNITIRNLQMPDGFAKQGIRFDYDSHDILITGNSAEDPMILDAQRQGPDGGCYGIEARGTVHDLIARFVHIYDCSSEETSSDFWDGDGFAAQTGCYGFLLDRVLAWGCADGGADLKGGTPAHPHEVIDSRFFYNTWNVKAWNHLNLRRCKFREPHKRGGTNTPHQIHLIARSNAHYIIEDTSFCDAKDSGTAFKVSFVGGIPVGHNTVIEIINSSYSGGMDEVWSNFPNATIIGAFIQGPVCNTPPTVAWENGAGAPADPAVGNYVRVTTSTDDWFGAATFEYQWRRDTEWVKFSTGVRHGPATADDVGVAIDCFVVGIHANGLHEGAVISEAADPMLAVVVPSGYGFLEHSPQATPLPSLEAGGLPTARFNFTLTDNDGNRVQAGAANSPIFQVGATDSAFEDNPRELEATMTDTLAEFNPVIKAIPYLIYKEFDELTRLIAPVAAGDKTGIGHFGNAAPIEDLPELWADLVAQGDPGQSIRLLSGTYAAFGTLPIVGGIEGEYIDVFGCNAAGVATGSTDKQLDFDYTTPAGDMSVAARYASINFNGFDKNSYLTKLVGSRTPWIPPPWCIFAAGTSGLANFGDGTAYAGYDNLTSAAFANNTVVTYRALLDGTDHFEDGTGRVVAGVLTRDSIRRSSDKVITGIPPVTTWNKIDFASPPDIFIRKLTSTNAYNGNTCFNFGATAKYFRAHHLRMERWGRSAFHNDVPSATGAHHIDIRNMYARNNQDFWWQDNAIGGGNLTPFTLHDLTFKHIWAEGFSKGFIKFDGDTNNVLCEDILANSYWQDKDNYARGFAMDGTAHSIVFRRCASLNTVDTTGSSGGNKQGDGMVAEASCYDILIDKSLIAGNCQGVDLKAIKEDIAELPIRVTSSVFFDNFQNMKLWGLAGEATDVINHDPYSHVTGSGAIINIECSPNSRTQWTFTGGSMSSRPSLFAISFENQRSRIKLVDMDIKFTEAQLVTPTSLGDLTVDGGFIDGVAIEDDVATGVPAFVVDGRAAGENGISLPLWPSGIRKGHYLLYILGIDGIGVPTVDLPLAAWDEWEELGEINIAADAAPAFTGILLGRRAQGAMYGPLSGGIRVLPEGVMRLSSVAAWSSVFRSGAAYERFTPNSGLSGNAIWPTLTTLGTDRKIIDLMVCSDNLSRGTVPAGYTEQVDFSTGAGGDGGMVIDDKTLVFAGAEPVRTRTMSNGKWVSFGIALKPAT